MKTHRVIYDGHRLDYSISGNGKQILFAFHGFGQHGKYYEPFAEKLGDIYTIYSFDLFYHGESDWKDKIHPLKKEDWKKIIEIIVDKHSIQTFAVCGYSMGGKFAMASLEAFPDKIDQLLLIAPDGIKTLFWYSLATYPTSFRRFFRAMVTKPKYFYNLINFSKKLGLVDKSLLKFANSQMNTRAKRRRVYLSWVTFRFLSFDLKKIAKIINQHKIPTYMITGKYDKIITANNMLDLLKHVHQYHNIILEAGHNSLIKDSAAYLDQHRELFKFRNHNEGS
ncbi:alpha/beta hydrolase [Marivirga sp. S37H4]|uniref:Alpha/beta hydrolase n=1 Tax=Marivirga aurantiaca TaxID=2802615 RepID=A0A934WWI7_9BACT|nr:alpha/beta hydrolase [Marivirga aurantiaca]MBK6264289.1 alpha/beta hydrolase [Marivirga aurantiaca]